MMVNALTRREMLGLSGSLIFGAVLQACGGKMTPEASDSNLLFQRAVELQRAYWTYDAGKKAILVSRYPDDLSWSELLQLHHLSCLELSRSDEGRAQLMSAELSRNLAAPSGAAHDLCQELLARLLSKESPYRARICALWSGEAGRSSTHSPDFYGNLRNASATHLGCVEVMHLDDDDLPTSISFVPFDDIRGMLFAGVDFFRYAKVLYEDARDEEIVLVPLLYGVSWFTDNEFDHDGTLTRFYGNISVNGIDADIGIGVGHQDFILAESESGESSLVGMGAVGELMMGLEVDDPRFDEKCRARGLDPDTVRGQLESE